MNAPSGIARAFSVALSFSLIGCGGNEAVLSTDTRVVLARPVVNMDSTTAVLQSTFQELSQGTYIFRGGTVVLDTGDVIVGSAGDGYLRLVRSVTRNGTLLQLETDPAALTDAIAEGEFSATFSTNTPGTSLRATSIVEQPLLPGVTVGNGQINFDNVLVFGNSTNGFSISGGHIAFKPSATLEGSIHHRSITHFKASVAGNITLDADLVLRSAGVFERSDSIPFYTAKSHFVADIGGLPVYTTVVTTFSFIPSIGFEGQAMVQSGLTVTAGLTMGAAYDNGQWTSLTGPNGGITIKPLTITVGGKVIATLGVKAESQFYVYGVSGPYVWAKPFFEADADIDLLRATYTSSCRTAINAGVGMYVKVFDLTLINFVQDADFLGTSWDSCKRTASLSASGVLAVASGNNQSAAVGLILPSQIVALVTSLSGAPVAGVTIVFATPDGGVVQPSAAVTNASGRAAASWTLGSVPGTQTATATAVGYSGSPGTFSALATNTASCPPLAYTLGQTVTGAITGSSCQYFNTQQSFDNYALTLATPQLLQFYMLAPFQAYASVNIDPAGGVSTGFPAPNSGTPVLEKVIAPAGNLYLRPAAYNVGSTGPYTFTVTPISSDITGCEKVVIMAGAVASQQLTSTDCTEGGHYSDRYLIALGVGWTAHITMRSTAFDAFLGLYYDFNDSFLTSDDDSGGGTDAQIVYTNTTNDILNYFIVATSARAGAQGAYTLTLTITEPSSLHAGDASPSRAGASIVPVPH